MPNDLPDWTSISVMTETAIPNSPFTVARNGVVRNINGVQLPLGTQWLVIGTEFPSDLAVVFVQGTTTSISYGSPLLVGTDQLLYVRVHPALDPTVNIALTPSNAGGNATVGIAFGYAPTVQDLDTLTPSPVFLVNENALALGFDHDTGGIPILEVSQQFTNPAPWQAGKKRVGIAATSVAANATLTLVAGVANQQIYPQQAGLWEDNANAAAGGRWVLQDSSGGTVSDILTAGARGLVMQGTLDAEPLLTGLGLQIKNLGANASFISGHLSYQQF